MRAAFVLGVLSIAACDPAFDTINCADGTVCPSDLQCPRRAGDLCFDPNAHCVGKPPGESCTPTIGGDGTCDGEGLCIPVTCGDSVVQERESCEASLGPDHTCIDLGFDIGRTACADDCSGSVSVTCGYIGWHDLRLFLETGQINDATLIAGVVWVAGEHGIYREHEGQWEKVLDGYWRFVIARGAEIWAINDVGWTTARFDGTAWIMEDLPPPMPSLSSLLAFAAVHEDELVLGTRYTNTVLRRVGDQWETATLFQSAGVLGGISAYAQLGATEVVAASETIISGFPPTVYTLTRMFRRDGGPWTEIPAPSELSTIDSFAGSSIDDYIAGGIHYDLITGQPTFLVRRVRGTGTGTPTMSPIAGSGRVASVGTGYLIIPKAPETLTSPADSVALGTWFQNGVTQRIEIPDRAFALASAGDRTVLVTDGAVFELGDAVWSPEPAVIDASPPTSPPEQQVTEVSALDLSSTPDRSGIFIVDRRPQAAVQGLVWRVSALAAQPSVVEQTRSIADTLGSWSDGMTYVTIATPSGAPKAFHFQGSTPSGGEFVLTDTVPRDIAGNASIDDGFGNLTMQMMIVGGGTTFARRWTGAAWVPATQGLVAPTGLRTVAGAGTGSYVAAGGGGLLARYRAGAWEQQTTGTTADLYAIDAVADHYTAVGDGVALRCDATTCTRDVLPSLVRSVAMRAPDDIFAVGGDSLHYDGVSWNRMRLGMRASHAAIAGESVWFADARIYGGIRRLVRVRPWQ